MRWYGRASRNAEGIRAVQDGLLFSAVFRMLVSVTYYEELMT